MAGAVIRSGAMVVLASGVMAAASAQTLPDPTRPPFGMAGNATGTSWETKTETPAAPLLQSVIMAKGKEPRALVNGVWLRMGESSGDLKIVKILADRVVIRGPQGRQTLRMTPDVEIKAAASARTGKPQPGKNK